MSESQTIQRVDLDPKTLLVDVNIRKDSKPDKDLVASIKELGVVVPIIAVRTASGDVRVRFGHRRTLAAIEAGRDTVPVEVVGDEGTDDATQIERILTQHAENEHRAGLSASEKVGVVAQLSAFGVKASEIAKKTRIPKNDVKAAVAVAESELAAKAVERYDFLTLEQAAVVAQFEDDPEAVKALIIAAERSERSFDHTVSNLRDRRERAAREAEAAERFTGETGVAVVTDPPHWRGTEGPVRLSQLAHHGEELTPENHTACPGHAAYLEEDWQLKAGIDDEGEDYEESDDDYEAVWEPVFVCTEPQKYGHEAAHPEQASRRGAAPLSEEQKAEQKAERRKLLANNKAWREAESIRREWLVNLLTRKTTPKDAATFIAQALIGDTWLLTRRDVKLLAHKIDGDDKRALVVALGVVVEAYESATGVHTWRNPRSRDTRYLARLVAWGYAPSEIEQSVIDSDTSDDEDEDEDDE